MTDTNVVFEDRFHCNTVDKDGKKFDRVSRIQASAHNTQAELTLDIAPELYALAAGETFALALAKSLNPDELDVNDTVDDVDAPKKVKRELWRSEDQGLAGEYEYVMYGKVYKFDDSLGGDNATTAYFSYGGLLMALRGSYRHLSKLVVGENIYLLIRK